MNGGRDTLRLPAVLWTIWCSCEVAWSNEIDAAMDCTCQSPAKSRIREALTKKPSWNNSEILLVSAGFFREFAAVDWNYFEFLSKLRELSGDFADYTSCLAKTPKKRLNYSEFLRPSRFNPRFCEFLPAKTPNKSKSARKNSEKTNYSGSPCDRPSQNILIVPSKMSSGLPALKPSPAHPPNISQKILFNFFSEFFSENPRPPPFG